MRIILIYLLLASMPAFSQKDGPEKIYMQIDKPQYAPGENVWFAVSILEAATLKPTPYSDIVYVDLVGPDGKVVETTDLRIRGGKAFGDFALSDQGSGGLYQLKATTSWNENFRNVSAYARDIPVQTISTERIQVVIDFEKDGYNPGDSVRVKLKIMDRNGQRLKNGEGSFNVSINGKNALSGAFRISGIGQALNFKLPESLNTSDVILQVTAAEGKTSGTAIRRVPVQIDKVNIQFFPEGGSWVANQPIKIGFKATNEFGKGVDVRGVVYNQKMDSITQLSSIHKGMGQFSFAPSSDDRYVVEIERSVGSNQLIPLRIKTAGHYSLSLKNNSKEYYEWEVVSRYHELIKITGKYNGKTLYDKSVFVEKGKNTIRIYKRSFPGGIVSFTLFDSFFDPQAERLVFDYPEDVLNISYTLNSSAFQPGDSANIEIRTTGKYGPVPAQLAIAVVDERLITKLDDKQANIEGQFWLSSEIRGKIEEPNFYFDTKEKDRIVAMENLMLTQGYREYFKNDIGMRPHEADKLTVLEGQVVSGNRSGRIIRLAELSGERRILETLTSEEGEFKFSGLNPDMSYVLIHDKEFNIRINSNKRKSRDQYSGIRGSVNYFMLRESDDMIINFESEENIAFEQIDVGLTQDVTALSEVVVTGYGSQTLSDLTGSVAHISANEITFNQLSGRVAGVTITHASGTSIHVRGYTSIYQQANPLLVVNGVPQLNGTDSNISLEDLSPSDIESFTVLKDAAATAIYGSRAANGVIIVNTRRHRLHDYGKYNLYRKSPFATKLILPYKFSYSRKFYRPVLETSDKESEDSYPTMYWKPNVVTDSLGYARVSFPTSELIGRSRIIAEGYSSNGTIGRRDSSLVVVKNLDIESKVPSYMGIEDELKIPVLVTNSLDSAVTIQVSVEITDSLIQLNTPASFAIELAPGEAEKVYLELTSRGLTGDAKIKIEASNGVDKDEMLKVIEIRHVGIPFFTSNAGSARDSTMILSFDKAEDASTQTSIFFYGNILNDIKQGIASILREPHGCFEQVSATAFPNVLALQFMKSTKSKDSEAMLKAYNLTAKGYEKLIKFELPGGGFEWFGNPPANVGLTAYGLIEFHEMAKVYSNVDPQMLQRTKNYLLSRRNGEGGFVSQKGKYGFAGASDQVTNAYVVFALAHVGEVNIIPEYEAALREAWQSKDMYRLGLMANAAFDLDRKTDYERLIEYLNRQLNTQNLPQWITEHSIVRSAGQDLKTETLSLWMLAAMKNPDNLINMEMMVEQLVSRRFLNRFGSTQATVMALMALTRYAEKENTKSRISEFEIYVNDQRVTRQMHLRNNSIPAIHGIEKYFSSEKNQKVRIKFIKGDPIPYSIDSKWNSMNPDNKHASPMTIKQVFEKDSVELGEAIRLTVEITNNEQEAQPMAIATFGLPAGFNPEPWQLKEHMEEGLFDYYEIINGNIHLYFREFEAGKTIRVPLDIIPTTSGTLKATPGSVYIYYNNRKKSWDPATEIVVLEDSIQ